MTKVPIVLYEGDVLDGWHRYNMCLQLDIPIRSEDYAGDCPLFHCHSLNVARRHLQPSQLAALAVDLLPSFEKDAKARQLAALKQNRNKQHPRGVTPDTTEGKSRSLVSKQLGVSEGYIQRAKSIKQKDPALFDALKQGKKDFREVNRELYLKKEAALKNTNAVVIRANDTRNTLHACDLVDAPIENNTLDAIITDPPYGKEFLDCWKKLGTFASQKLKGGGVLIAMTGTYFLPEVIDNLRADGLNYYWPLCYHMPQSGSFPQCRKVHQHWKCVLWYVKGNYDRTFQNTDFYSEPLANCAEGKKYHKWGQSFPFFTKLVEQFTYADELVCDPFVGGGTTALACMSLKRRFIGIDVDERAIATTSQRIKDFGSQPSIIQLPAPSMNEESLAA